VVVGGLVLVGALAVAVSACVALVHCRAESADRRAASLRLLLELVVSLYLLLNGLWFVPDPLHALLPFADLPALSKAAGAPLACILGVGDPSTRQVLRLLLPFLLFLLLVGAVFPALRLAHLASTAGLPASRRAQAFVACCPCLADTRRPAQTAPRGGRPAPAYVGAAQVVNPVAGGGIGDARAHRPQRRGFLAAPAAAPPPPPPPDPIPGPSLARAAAALACCHEGSLWCCTRPSVSGFVLAASTAPSIVLRAATLGWASEQFRCARLGPGAPNVIMAEPLIECSANGALQAVAVVMYVVFGLLVPLALATMLMRLKAEGRLSAGRQVATWGFLFVGFKTAAQSRRGRLRASEVALLGDADAASDDKDRREGAAEDGGEAAEAAAASAGVLREVEMVRRDADAAVAAGVRRSSVTSRAAGRAAPPPSTGGASTITSPSPSPGAASSLSLRPLSGAVPPAPSSSAGSFNLPGSLPGASRHGSTPGDDKGSRLPGAARWRLGSRGTGGDSPSPARSLGYDGGAGSSASTPSALLGVAAPPVAMTAGAAGAPAASATTTATAGGSRAHRVSRARTGRGRGPAASLSLEATGLAGSPLPPPAMPPPPARSPVRRADGAPPPSYLRDYAPDDAPDGQEDEAPEPLPRLCEALPTPCQLCYRSLRRRTLGEAIGEHLFLWQPLVMVQTAGLALPLMATSVVAQAGLVLAVNLPILLLLLAFQPFVERRLNTLAALSLLAQTALVVFPWLSVDPTDLVTAGAPPPSPDFISKAAGARGPGGDASALQVLYALFAWGLAAAMLVMALSRHMSEAEARRAADEKARAAYTRLQDRGQHHDALLPDSQ